MPAESGSERIARGPRHAERRAVMRGWPVVFVMACGVPRPSPETVVTAKASMPPAFAIGAGGSFRYGPRASLGVDLDGLIRVTRETYVHVGGAVGGAHSNNLSSSEGADGSFFDIKAGLARLHCGPSACLSVRGGAGFERSDRRQEDPFELEPVFHDYVSNGGFLEAHVAAAVRAGDHVALQLGLALRGGYERRRTDDEPSVEHGTAQVIVSLGLLVF